MLYDTYKPIIYDVSSAKKKNRVLDNKPNVTYANTIAMPLLTLGFHKELYKTKGEMDKLNEYANRKKIYLVTSLFEKEVIDRREDNSQFYSIGEALNNFIETNISKKLPPILTRAYLKLWELITEFDLIHDKKNFTSGHLAEGPGSFIQATILYRDFLAKNKKIDSSKDKYYAVTLHSTNEYLHMEKQFIDYYKKEKPQRLHILETIPTKDIKDLYGGGTEQEINKTDGDLTKLLTINIFSGGGKQKGFAEKCDLITADGGFEWKDENFQEQEAFRLIFGEILTALKTQKEGGHFVIKIFDTFTFPTLKLIELLRDYYKNVYIAKPYTSRISNAERYIVCKEFEGISDKDLKILEDLLNDFDKNSEFNIINIFPEYKIDDNDLKHYVKINRNFALTQYVGMNKILTFLNLDNKNGSEYNNYLDLQINASKLWNETFLDNKKILKLSEEIKKYIEHNNEKIEDKQVTPMMKFNLSDDSEIVEKIENINKKHVKSSTNKTVKKVKKSKEDTENSVVSKPKKIKKSKENS